MFRLSGFRVEWVYSPIEVGDDGGWVFRLSGFRVEWVCSPIKVGDDARCLD